MDPLYKPFADYARKYGLEQAVESFASVPADKVAAFKAQFEADLARVEEGGPPIITAGCDDWYGGPLEQDRFWGSLSRYFYEDGWPDDRISSVNDASNVVVGHTPRPTRPAWDAKGLVVGYVQSGKTTNFIAVMAKMADVDYRMVIVLSGIHNGLRKQTQERLDDTLTNLNPDYWHPLTDDKRDFLKPTYDPSAVLNSTKVVMAVVKKNKAVLTKLVNWLDTTNGKKALQNAPVLIIDDEADQASVATQRINPLIRRLLDLMPKRTYIGYTATPFANVFIDPTDSDLYPKTFILNLPRPKDYFGPEKIFGREGVEGEDLEDGDGPPDGYDMVRTVPENDVPLLRPGAREPAEEFIPTMTAELLDAIYWFWLATAARRARGQKDHSTMLIHTSVNTVVHTSYKAPLESLREKALGQLITNDVDALAHWRDLWNRESRRVPAADFGLTHLAFEEIEPFLTNAVRDTKVILDNYRSKDRLDYSGDPVVAIAVGGNTLSRGLTLYGLVVSFFVRAATAYDTLLQMGRWFGYRTGYEDLPRIWMTPSLESAFRHLATVEHEMRDDIDRYQRENLKPDEVAVRIKTHPALRITAKMGAAQPAAISYAGRRLQTRYFLHKLPDWLTSNFDAASFLIQNAAARSNAVPVDETSSTPKLLIRDVPVGLVKEFLTRYQIHKDSPDLDTTLMIKYIDEQLVSDRPSLETWSIAVVSGEGPTIDFGGLQVNTVSRSRLNDNDPERADIKTLMSKEDRALDLGIRLTEARRASEGQLIARRNSDPVMRDRGLVVLYPIDQTSLPDRTYEGPGDPPRIPLDAVGTVVGLGIVFPGDVLTRAVQASYVAVDLTDVETEDIDEALTVDTEDEDHG
ncbi:Z1 domain-containing protein [Mycobacterium lentiflavum]|uniref:Z1 domain-containing protein n=1 Tax=Mycobacterium lentiflavum TaxID=141349 RepID=UPI001586229C|nr:Z1 domain-containing protein [Mycobacterium lentiflavum]